MPTKSARIGQLPVAPVDEHRQLDRLGAAELGDRVERGPDRAAGEEDVVDEHHDPAGHVHRHLGRTERLHRAQADVVPVEGDVQRPDRHRRLFERGDRGGQPVGDGRAAGVQADEDQVLGAVVALDDLVRDPGVGPAEVGGVEDPGPEDEAGTGAGSSPGHGTTPWRGGRRVRLGYGASRRALGHACSSVGLSQEPLDGVDREYQGRGLRT